MPHRFAPRNSKKRPQNNQKLHCEPLEQRLALTVVINEFLAENNDGIEDLAGHRHDWVELKNTGAGAADISGWYLTDDASQPTKWQIPSTPATTSLAAGATLLVYASGNNGEVGAVGDELHTNFQLSQEPGYLGLIQGDGSTVESEYNLYPQQTPDVSYGLGVGVGSTTTETFLSAGSSSTGDGSPAQFRPFTGINAEVDDHWTEIDYVASGNGWVNTTNGLGHGYSSPWQDSNIQSAMSGELAGYVRMPFTVTDAAQLTSMNLELRVDNGYIVYLNGREIQRERISALFKIGNDWNDSKQNGGLNAKQNISDSTITGSPAVIDLTPWLDTIEEGANVLAIYAAKHTSDTGDYLVHAELTGERANGAVGDSFMVSPTPNMNNGAGYEGVLIDTEFSHDRGFYDAPFNLTITPVGPDGLEVPGTTVRYTIDGSMPTLTNGMTYSGAITVNPATLSYTDAGVVTVRAAAFKDGYFSTNVDTQSYIFLDEVLTQDGSGLPSYTNWGNSGADWDVDPNIVNSVGAENLKNDLKAIPTMSLVLDWEDFFGDGSPSDSDDAGIYPQIDDWREKSDERYASLEYFTHDLSEEFQIDAKVEIQGHSSTFRANNNWRSDKLSLEVKFKQPYDTKLSSDTLFGNSVNAGENVANDFDSLVLDAQYNYTFHTNNTTTQGPYATFIHDQVVADLQNMAGGQAPHGRWVHLYINGMYWGIYNAHERPSDAFGEEYGGGDKDDYLVVKGFEGQNLSHGGSQGKYQQSDGGIASQIAYQAMLDQVDDNLSNLSEYQEVAELIDIDDFIDYMVVLYYAGNYDWGELNWFASINGGDPNGKWRFHSWDQEHAFPNDQNGDSRSQDYDHTNLVANDFGEHEYGPTGIHHMLMESDEYRLRFSDRVEHLLRNDGLLTPANAQAVWQARIDELADAINGEAARWGDNRNPDKTGATWLTNVEYTRDNFFFPNGSYDSRTDIVIDIFNNTLPTGGSDEVGKVDWLVNLDAPTFNQYGGEFTAPFNLVLMNPNGGGTIYYTTDGSDPRDAGGAISSSAIEYTGAVSLTEGVQIRARVYDSGQSGSSNDWSAEVDKTFLVDEPLSLRIVELMYNPTESGASEYIELLNIGDETIDLTGVQITEFSTGGFTFSGGTLAAGERIVVAEDVVAFQAQYPSVTNVVATSYSGSLSNGGETVALVDSFGTVLQSFTYGVETPWPTTPNDGGPSLEYIGPLTGTEDPLAGSPADPFDDPTNWQASAANGGSPGVDGTQSAGIPGDYDNSGTVDSADYAKWKTQFGMTVADGTESDGNGDGKVNLADYVVWRNNLGATTPPPVVQTISAVAAVESSSGVEVAVFEAAAEPDSVEQTSTAPASFASVGKSSGAFDSDAIDLTSTQSPSSTTEVTDNLLLLLAGDRAEQEERLTSPEPALFGDAEAKEEVFATLAENSHFKDAEVRFDGLGG